MEKQKTLILNGNLRRLLFQFSLPAVTGMVIVALYNFVDTLFVGRGVGPLAIAGLTVVLPVMIFMIAIGLLTGVGAASVVSRSLGSSDSERARIAAGNSIILNLVLNIPLIAVFYLFMDRILTFLGASADVLPYAKDYLEIILIGFVFYTFSINGNNLIRAEGKPRASMYAMLIGACLNIALDPLFIFVLGMGVRGAAIATVISQAVSCIYIYGFFLSAQSIFHLNLDKFRLRKKISREVLAIGIPSFLMEIIGSLMFILFIKVVQRYGGDMYIAITGIGIRIIDLIFMPILGISHGFSPIVGFNYGAELFLRVKKTLKEALLWTVIISSTGLVFMVIFPEFLLGFFTDDPEIISKGVMPLRLIAILSPLWSFPILGAAFFQAIGKAQPALFITLSRNVLFFVPAVLLLPALMGLTGVWLSWPVTDIFSFMVSFAFLYREVRIIGRVNLSGSA
ncbi:MAG: MATE family efflux transporter [Actinomycetota bacterium]